MLADMYGQGHAASALQFGWTLARAKEVAFKIRDGLPILYQLIDALKQQSELNGRITTLSGRVLDQRFAFNDASGARLVDIAERYAPNHFCQGTALDVMHYSILELDRRGLSDHAHLWMHDEIVADASIAEELTAVMSTPPPFLEAVAAHHGMEAFLAVDLNEVGQRWKSV
jgi:DNA polymerase I-like protein with 3'-5' exonuclease and polymerase domains